jgi:hypothetical protein
VIGDWIYAEPWGFDLATGVQRTKAGGGNWTMDRSYGGCGGFTAAQNMLIFRKGMTSYYDLRDDSGITTLSGAQRPNCWMSASPGDGIIVAPEGSVQCWCAYAIQSSAAYYSQDPTAYQPWMFSVVRAVNVFYNNSAFDGNDPAASVADDAAVATDKTPLLSGETATLANYTSYAKGINGIMVDIAGGLPGTLTANDFIFKVGNDNATAGWTTPASPVSITVREGAGDGGSNRVTLIWPDNAIQKQWLQITVKATPTTGLAADYVCYFGNSIGESGDSATGAVVDTTDEVAARVDIHKNFTNPASVTNACDFNRDGRVDTTDEIIVRNHVTTFVTRLSLITAP